MDAKTIRRQIDPPFAPPTAVAVTRPAVLYAPAAFGLPVGRRLASRSSYPPLGITADFVDRRSWSGTVVLADIPAVPRSAPARARLPQVVKFAISVPKAASGLAGLSFVWPSPGARQRNMAWRYRHDADEAI